MRLKKRAKKPGPKPKDGPKCVRKSISIPEDLWLALEKEAMEKGISISLLIRERLSNPAKDKAA
jgi:hypothetical protein